MARYRFPGKALKLNCRKRKKFRNWSYEVEPEDTYTDKIVRGYELFQELFGLSEEVRLLVYLETNGISCWMIQICILTNFVLT